MSVPRVAELLADPAFHPLADWLRGRQVDVEALQAEVDQFLETARQAALEQDAVNRRIPDHDDTVIETPLAELLTQLETAVRAEDRERATRLQQAILQRLATGAADHAAVERQVRLLMETLEQSAAHPGIRQFDPLNLERSLSDEGTVYPVWFGTNRKPTAQGDGFTGERHDRVTRGRVEVYVPEAHRFGETGSSFWEALDALRPARRPAAGAARHAAGTGRLLRRNPGRRCRPRATAASRRTRCSSCTGST